MREFTASLLASSLLLCVTVAGCGTGTRGNNNTGGDGGSDNCTNGTKRCEGLVWQACVNQSWKTVESCGDFCDTALGCTECPPNGTKCDGNNVLACDAQGHAGAIRTTCKGSCVGGTCTDACGKAAAELSYLGCDYFPTVTANNDLIQTSHFAVAIANPGGDIVEVSITRGAFMMDGIMVPPGGLQTVTLPWVPELLTPSTKDPMTGLPNFFSTLVRSGAYKLSASAPVNVYQFNPLEFQTKPGCPPGDRTCFTFSNDASLLLPTSTMTGHYIVIARPSWMLKQSIDYGFGGPPTNYKLTSPGFFTVVGAETVTKSGDGGMEEVGQEVNILFKAPTLASNGGVIKAYRGGERGTFTLKQGDALQIMSAGVNDCMSLPGDKETQTDQNGYLITYNYCDLGEAYDLTGTEIESAHKVAVFSGHNCTFVPYNKWACDHLEEAMLPLEGWGKQYIGTHSQRSPITIPDLWRVVSGTDGNMITFDPPSAHEPVMLDRGRWIEFSSKGDFVANGTGAFALAQFMVGQNYAPNAGTSPGDPAMSIAVPTEQYRSNYTFLTPATYTLNYVNVTAPTGMDGALASAVTLDGEAIDPAKFRPIGDSGKFLGARVPLPKDGTHSISSDKPFGIQVYGLASYTSYMYPGGLDVKQINVQ